MHVLEGQIKNLICTISEMKINNEYSSYNENLKKKYEDIYKSKIFEILKDRRDFGLIHKGIVEVLSKDDFTLILKYKMPKNGIDLVEIKKIEEICDGLLYFIHIFKTRNGKRFGVFEQSDLVPKKTQPNFYMNNNMGNNINNNFNNNFNNNINNNDLNNNNRMNKIRGNRNQINNNYNQCFSTNSQIIFRGNAQITKNDEKMLDTLIDNIIFIFSLDSQKLYFKNDKSIHFPSFTLYFDNNREVLYGCENSGSCILSGKNEFNIVEYEIIEIMVNNNNYN